ncbi:MAG: cytochrome c [Bacteroidales bacterium]
MFYIKSILIIFTTALILAACSGNNKRSDQGNREPIRKEEQPAAKAEENLSQHPGKPLYAMHCLPCHQLDGNGVPGMYPPLNETEWVNGDKATLIDIVLHGMNEEIEVNGNFYNLAMAPLPHLTDQEVADVLNYVRKKFGSATEEVTPGEVTAIRGN